MIEYSRTTSGCFTARVVSDGKNVAKIMAAITVAAVAISAPQANADTVFIGGTASSPQWQAVITAVTGTPAPPASPPKAGVVNVTYPASIWPLTGIDKPFLRPSVDAGTVAVLAAISTPGPHHVVGLSQGALVEHAVQNQLPADQPGVTFAYYGDPINSHNGILHVVPINFEGYQDPGIHQSVYPTTEVINQYDAVADFPDRPLNVVADLNAIAGFALEGRHNAYNTNTLPTGAVVTQTGNTTTYFVKDKDLPLAQVLVSAGVDKRFVNAITPGLRAVVEAGYAPSAERGTAKPKHAVAPHKSGHTAKSGKGKR